MSRIPASPADPGDRAGSHVSAQVAAAWSALDAAQRANDLAAALRGQDRALLDALSEMKVARDFVGSPANILGSETTKHGEIAEQVHVAVSRARDVLHGRTPTASFDGIPRTGPVDYREAGADIQSKYCNGLRNTLDRVAADAEKHPEFASRGGRYHIPATSTGNLTSYAAPAGSRGCRIAARTPSNARSTISNAWVAARPTT